LAGIDPIRQRFNSHPFDRKHSLYINRWNT
jgi:hypothetical protein